MVTVVVIVIIIIIVIRLGPGCLCFALGFDHFRRGNSCNSCCWSCCSCCRRSLGELQRGSSIFRRLRSLWQQSLGNQFWCLEILIRLLLQAARTLVQLWLQFDFKAVVCRCGRCRCVHNHRRSSICRWTVAIIVVIVVRGSSRCSRRRGSLLLLLLFLLLLLQLLFTFALLRGSIAQWLFCEFEYLDTAILASCRCTAEIWPRCIARNNG